jgi:hypothetical protein
MSTPFAVVALLGLPIFLTLVALWQIRSLAGRRSPRREVLATAGVICIISGFALKLFLLANPSALQAFDSARLAVVYPLSASGYILLLFGFVGWDRMLLSRPGWAPPLTVIGVMVLLCAVIARATDIAWWYVPFAVVIGSVLMIDLLFLGFALRQRLYIAVPFLLLHIVSVLVSTAIELRPTTDTTVLNGVLLSATTSALLFAITTQLITRHTGRGRMLIV